MPVRPRVFGYDLWRRALGTGAGQLWRIRQDARLECEQRLPDGSYLSFIYPSSADRKRRRNGIRLRVVEYRLEGVEGSDPLYRLATSLIDPEQAPAQELGRPLPERWEIETAFDEWKTHQRGSRIVLRSKTLELARQEFYGLLMTHSGR